MFGDHIYSKKPESSDSMYSSILILEKIWYHHFTKSGPNFGSPATHNWNKIHNIFSSKSGHQKYSVWVPGDPTQSYFAVWCQIFWTKLLHLSVFLVKQYASFIYVKRMPFCLANWAFPFVGSWGPISCRKVEKNISCIWELKLLSLYNQSEEGIYLVQSSLGLL